jgi:type IV secretion system protein VirB4
MLARAIRSDLPNGRAIGREKSLSAHIPYLRHVDEEVIRTKENHFLSIIRVAGFCFQTADQSEINLKLLGRNTAVRALNDSRFSLYSHVIRRQATIDSPSDFDNPFCAALERGHLAGLQQRRMYTNELYLTLIRRGFQGKVGRIEAISSLLNGRTKAEIAEQEKEALRDLKEATRNMVAALDPYGAQVLTVRARKGEQGYVLFSEPCEFLAQLINGALELPMALPRMSLDGYLPTRRVTFGRKLF